MHSLSVARESVEKPFQLASIFFGARDIFDFLRANEQLTSSAAHRLTQTDMLHRVEAAIDPISDLIERNMLSVERILLIEIVLLV